MIATQGGATEDGECRLRSAIDRCLFEETLAFGHLVLRPLAGNSS